MPMPRRRDEHSPDLFAQREPAAQRLAATSPMPSSFRLPSNLDAGLRALDDEALKRLKDAVEREAQRRFPQPTPTAPHAPKPNVQAKKAALDRPAKAISDPGIGIGKANMIRAAFKAGLKPAAIARQFHLSPAIVRAVLAGNEKRQEK